MTDILRSIDTCDCCVFALARVLVSARFHNNVIASMWWVIKTFLKYFVLFILNEFWYLSPWKSESEDKKVKTSSKSASVGTCIWYACTRAWYYLQTYK